MAATRSIPSSGGSSPGCGEKVFVSHKKALGFLKHGEQIDRRTDAPEKLLPSLARRFLRGRREVRMACNQCDLVVEIQVGLLDLGRSHLPLDRRGRPLRAKVMAPHTPGRATGNCSINARSQGKVSPSHSAPKAIKASSCAAMSSWSLRFLTGLKRCNVLSIDMIGASIVV